MPHDVRGASVLMPAHVHRTSSGHGGPVPLRHTEPRVVQTIVHSTGAQCRGDRVGRQAGDVGATRWVAPRGRCTYGRRVGSHAAAVHDGGRAIYRDGIAAARHGAG